ncbi:hypothetical protein [Chryseobacterium luteum]|nr:hypothetical protein [Chryseobacterium luteum]
MKTIIIFLILFSNCAFAQQQIPVKEAIPKGGLLNQKIKQTKWYFNTDEISDNKLDLNSNAAQPDILDFVDASKFLITLRDGTKLSGTYQIFDLGDMGTHTAPKNYKTFKVNKTQNLDRRATKLATFLQQDLNVHYDLEQKTMDFISNDNGPIVPSS